MVKVLDDILMIRGSTSPQIPKSDSCGELRKLYVLLVHVPNIQV
jgi:hypothetical protein